MIGLTGAGRRFGTALSILLLTGSIAAAGSPSPEGTAPSPESTPVAASAEPSPLPVACQTSGILADAASPPPGAIAVTLVDFKLEPAQIDIISVSQTFLVTNQGPTPHNFTVRDATGTILCGTNNLRTNESEILSVTLAASSNFVTFCSLPGHESLGVVGALIVSEPRPIGSVAPSGSPGP